MKTKEKLVVFICVLTSILPLLDTTIVTVVLGDIERSFSLHSDEITWVMTAYLIGMALMIPILPTITHRYGILRTWIGAMFIFALGSLIGGLSTPYFSTLVLGRLLQGLGAGLLTPLVQIILVNNFGRENLRMMMAYVGIPAAFIPAIAPLFGSLISTYFSWQALFLMNLPIILLTLLLGYPHIPRSEPVTGRHYRLVGLILFCLGYTLILFLLKQSSLLFQNTFIYLLSFGIGLTVLLFSIWDMSHKENSAIQLKGFQSFGYSIAIFSSFVVGLIFFGFLVLYPNVRIHMDDQQSLNFIGAMLCVQGVGALISRNCMKWEIIKRMNSLLIIPIGLLIVGIATFLLGFSVQKIWFEGLAFLIRGFGIGISTIAVLSAPLEWASKDIYADTSSLSRMVLQLGGAMGIIIATGLTDLAYREAYSLFSLITVILALGLLYTGTHILRKPRKIN
ncbi:MAG: MFS transporter [Neisseriaceae bacterium]|nr:MAG: MFS transporter [Neisseriaceae bacterium]